VDLRAHVSLQLTWQQIAAEVGLNQSVNVKLALHQSLHL
jgi:hypothetical protein